MSAGEGRRRRGRAGGVLVVAALCAVPASACEVCFGRAAATAPMVSSVRLGVFLLLGVTLVMLGAFGAFFVYLRNRARQAESAAIDNEWAELQRRSLEC